MQPQAPTVIVDATPTPQETNPLARSPINRPLPMIRNCVIVRVVSTLPFLKEEGISLGTIIDAHGRYIVHGKGDSDCIIHTEESLYYAARREIRRGRIASGSKLRGNLFNRLHSLDNFKFTLRTHVMRAVEARV